MPTTPHAVPSCGVCGATLTTPEQAVNLRMISQLIATGWPLVIRLYCARCAEPPPPAAS
jgi:hypothetical protein